MLVISVCVHLKILFKICRHNQHCSLYSIRITNHKYNVYECTLHKTTDVDLDLGTRPCWWKAFYGFRRDFSVYVMLLLLVGMIFFLFFFFLFCGKRGTWYNFLVTIRTWCEWGQSAPGVYLLNKPICHGGVNRDETNEPISRRP